MANVASLRNKMIDITNDIQANASHHICVVETWLEMNKPSKNVVSVVYNYIIKSIIKSNINILWSNIL